MRYASREAGREGVPERREEWSDRERRLLEPRHKFGLVVVALLLLQGLQLRRYLVLRGMRTSGRTLELLARKAWRLRGEDAIDASPTPGSTNPRQIWPHKDTLAQTRRSIIQRRTMVSVPCRALRARATRAAAPRGNESLKAGGRCLRAGRGSGRPRSALPV